MRDEVLLALPDTRLRALVLAQLQEEGYQVVAVPRFSQALRLLARGLRPRAVVAELEDAPEVALEGLRRSGVTVLAVAGQLDRAKAERLAVPCMLRPFTVGQLVDRVRDLVGPPRGTSSR